MTTIYILVKALIDMAESEADKDALLNTVFNVDKFNKYNIDESSKMKLKPVKNDNDQLMLLMSNKHDEIVKSSGIYRNYVLFCDLVKKAMEEDENIGVSNIYDGLELGIMQYFFQHGFICVFTVIEYLFKAIICFRFFWKSINFQIQKIKEE